jgi:hypothetical protein
MSDPQHTSDASQDQATEQARAVWHDVKDMAQSAASSRQRAAARGLGDFATALRRAAQDTDTANEGATLTRVADGVAGGLERLSSRLQDRNLNSLLREAEDFARKQPLLFFGAALFAGFAATRFLKSSDPAREHRRRRSAPAHDGPGSTDAASLRPATDTVAAPL